MPRKRIVPNIKEKALGMTGTTARARGILGSDFFQNLSARSGYGTPNLLEGTTYPLVRFTYDYWTLISLYEGHWLCRRIVDTPAEDMVRTWPKVTGGLKPPDLAKLDRAVRRTRTRGDVLTTKKWARLFGGAGALIVVKGHENALEEPLSPDDIELGAYQGLLPFDRWAGIQPVGTASTDFSRPQEFNLPEYYNVTAVGGEQFKVHASRIVRFTGPTNPTPEREAYSWWGISVLEPLIEEIKKYDNMNWNIVNLTFRANILGMKYPDLAALITGLGSSRQQKQKWEQAMLEINHLISNQSLIPLPEKGGLESVQYTFAGLAEVMMTQMLIISGGAGIPVTRLWGRTYSGLGQAGDGDERIYEERIASDDEVEMRPQMEKLYPIICMSELGDVPEDLGLTFPSVRVLDEKEKSDLAKTVVDTVTVALNSGGISKRTYAQELKQSSNKTEIFSNITDEFIASLSDEAQEESELGAGLFGEEEGEPNLTPASAPQKVLREEGKAKAADALGAGDYMLRRIQEEESRRNWNLLPSSFEVDAVRRAFSVIKPYFERNEVSARIVASKATSFEELRNALQRYHAKDEDTLGTRRTVGPFEVIVETPRGGVRRGKDWAVTLPADYGYLPGYKGADGDSVDVYVGPNLASDTVYVVDQMRLDKPRTFDEHKALLGFNTRNEALDAYMAGHHASASVFGAITPMTTDGFRSWLSTADLRRPCSSEVRA